MNLSSLAFEYQGDVIETAFALTKVSLFADLAPETLLPLAHVVEKRGLAPGEILCNEGDFGDALYVVHVGTLEVVVNDTVRGRIQAGEAAGELALLDGQPRSATLRAAGPDRVQLYVMDREDLLELLDAHPVLAVSLLKTLAKRIVAAERG